MRHANITKSEAACPEKSEVAEDTPCQNGQTPAPLPTWGEGDPSGPGEGDFPSIAVLLFLHSPPSLRRGQGWSYLHVTSPPFRKDGIQGRCFCVQACLRAIHRGPPSLCVLESDGYRSHAHSLEFGGELVREMFLKELLGFGAYEVFEVVRLDLLSVFLGQSLLFVDRFEMTHDSIKKHSHLTSVHLALTC